MTVEWQAQATILEDLARAVEVFREQEGGTVLSIQSLGTQIRIALATNPKVTVNTDKPKQLWRALKKELLVCDVTFDDHAVYVTWKAVP